MSPQPVPDIEPEVTTTTILAALATDSDNIREIVVICRMNDGTTEVRTTSSWGPTILWMLDKAKHILMHEA